MSFPKKWPIITALACAVAVALIAKHVLPNSEETPLNPIEGSAQPFILASGQTFSKTVQATDQPLTGFVIYTSSSETLPDLNLTVHQHHLKQDISTWDYIKTPSNNVHKLTFFLPKLITRANQRLSIHIHNAGQNPVSLLASHNNEPALSLLIPLPPAPGVLSGIYIGLAVALATIAWQIWPAYQHGIAIAILIVLAPLAVSGFWLPENHWGVGDWNYRFSQHEIYRRTIREFSQFPLWNPYTCGGTAAFADPESSLLNPLTLLELALGIPRGIKLHIYLMLAVTSTGMYALARRLQLSAPAATLSAILTTYSSALILRVVEGHVTIIYGFMWVPWLFYFWLRAYQARRQNTSRMFAAASGCCVTLIFFSGGIYVLSYTAIIFAGLILFIPKPRHALLVTLTACGLGVGLSAIKLVPAVLWLKQFPDEHYVTSTTTYAYLFDIFFGRHMHAANVLPGQVSGWHEYGAYIGIPAAALIAISLTKSRYRWARLLFSGVVAVTLLSSAGPLLAPAFDKLDFIPRSNISRISLYALLGASLLAGAGLDVIRQKFSKSAIITTVVIALITVDLFSLSFPISQQAFKISPVYPHPKRAASPIAFDENFYHTRNNGQEHNRDYAAVKAGYGTFSFCSVLGPKSAVTTIQSHPQQPFISATPTSVVTLEKWTPNTISLHYAAGSGSTIILNNNYAEGWNTNYGLVINHDGRLALRVPAGEASVVISYVPPGIWLGAGITFATLIILAIFIYYPRTAHEKRRTA